MIELGRAVILLVNVLTLINIGYVSKEIVLKIELLQVKK